MSDLDEILDMVGTEATPVIWEFRRRDDPRNGDFHFKKAAIILADVDGPEISPV